MRTCNNINIAILLHLIPNSVTAVKFQMVSTGWLWENIPKFHIEKVIAYQTILKKMKTYKLSDQNLNNL